MIAKYCTTEPCQCFKLFRKKTLYKRHVRTMAIAVAVLALRFYVYVINVTYIYDSASYSQAFHAYYHYLWCAHHCTAACTSWWSKCRQVLNLHNDVNPPCNAWLKEKKSSTGCYFPTVLHEIDSHNRWDLADFWYYKHWLCKFSMQCL